MTNTNGFTPDDKDEEYYSELKNILRQANIAHENKLSEVGAAAGVDEAYSGGEFLYYNLANALRLVTIQLEYTKKSIPVVRQLIELDKRMLDETEKSLGTFEEGLSKIDFILTKDAGAEELTPEFLEKAIEFINVANNILQSFYNTCKRHSM